MLRNGKAGKETGKSNQDPANPEVIDAALAIQALRNATGDVTMPRGGKRSTSWKAGQSGNPRGRPKHAVPERLQAAPRSSVRVCLDITPSGASALRQCGLIAAGEETAPSALGNGLLEAAARYLGLAAD
jgi:uncharacterized protein DUF5681